MNGRIQQPQSASAFADIARFLVQIISIHDCTLPEACGIFAGMMVEQNIANPGRWPQDPIDHWLQLSGYSERECQLAVAKYLGDGMDKWIEANQ